MVESLNEYMSEQVRWQVGLLFHLSGLVRPERKVQNMSREAIRASVVDKSKGKENLNQRERNPKLNFTKFLTRKNPDGGIGWGERHLGEMRNEE